MDNSRNLSQLNYGGLESKITTQAIKVMITTDVYEIEGFLHIKPGGYQSRVSDLLNAKGLQYIPITRPGSAACAIPRTRRASQTH